MEKSNSLNDEDKVENTKLNFFALRKDAHISIKCIDFLKFLSLLQTREIKEFNPNTDK